MAGVSVELALVIGYAVFLALVAFILEAVARHMHRRSVAARTAGFVYHRDRDVWICPHDQHLFPVFSDRVRGKVLYRAPAAACNVCPSKAACTDSATGREIERLESETVESGMLRFHRAFSLMLLALAGSLIAIELFRAQASQLRVALAAMLLLLTVSGFRLSSTMRNGGSDAPPATPLHRSR